MLKYSTESDYDKGFLLELSSSGDIISAKALLVNPTTQACIDIFSIPLDDNRRIIAVPDWNFSYIFEPSAPPSHFYTILYDDIISICLSEIFFITIDVMHSIIDSSHLLNTDYANGNDISDVDPSLYNPSRYSNNQFLPF